MASNLGTLTLDLVAKVGGFMKPLDKAERKSKSATEKMKRHQERLRKKFKETTVAVAKWGAGIIAAASAAGIAMAKSSMEATAEMQKNANMAGISVVAFQELSHAARYYQISQDALTDGFKELALRVEEFVITGAGPAKEALERLKYTQEDLNKKLKDTPALFTEIVGKLEKMDQASKIRIADELFGGQGGEQFVALINGGAKALGGLTKEAEDLGLVLSSKLIDQTIDARRSIGKLTNVMGANFNKIVADLAPEITKVTEILLRSTDEIAKSLSITFKSIITAGTVAIAVLDGIGTAASRAAKKLFGHNKGVKEGGGFWGLMNRSSDAYWKKLDKNMQKQTKQTKNMDRVIEDTVKKYSGFLKELWKDPGADSENSSTKKLSKQLKDLRKGLKLTNDKKKASEKAAKGVIEALKFEREQLGRTAQEQELYNQIKNASVKLNSKQGKEIQSLVTAIQKEREELKQALQTKTMYLDLLKEGATVYDTTKTNAENLSNEVAKLDTLYKNGAISLETYQRASKGIFKGQDIDSGINLDKTPMKDLQKQEENLKKWYDAQLQMLSEFRQSSADLNDLWNKREAQVHKRYSDNIEKIELSRQQLVTSSAASFFGEMSNLTGLFVSEQHSAYKAMFAVSKAFAIAESSVKLWQAVAIAGASTTWPANLGAMASVLAAMSGLVGNIMAIGMAHEGIDSVPESGTWLLKKGERVTTAETSKKLDDTLSSILRGVSGTGMNVTINEAPGTSVTVNERNDGIDIDIELIEERMAERINRGTGLSPFLDGRYGRRY